MVLSNLNERLAWLDSMKSWPANWNSYTIPAPREDLIEQAKAWLTSFHGLVGKFWLKPSITGNCEGGVHLEWFCGARNLSVDIDENEIWYLKAWGPDCVTEMEEGDASLPGFLNVWYWLRGTNEQP